MAGTKAELRSHYRQLRRGLPDQRNRSNVICRLLEGHTPATGTVMVYDAVNGEVDLHRFAEHCRSLGLTVVVPEEEPDPATIDLVVVPGVAFTAAGHRLGQGGGWYDRFLTGLRPGVARIGVCFAECLVDELPTEAHDVVMDLVLTDA
ncbi:MAG: 5-formyltetrahydrofolate cyclo-ligase [Ilumatobacteraceae bacterium]